MIPLTCSGFVGKRWGYMARLSASASQVALFMDWFRQSTLTKGTSLFLSLRTLKSKTSTGISSYERLSWIPELSEGSITTESPIDFLSIETWKIGWTLITQWAIQPYTLPAQCDPQSYKDQCNGDLFSLSSQISSFLSWVKLLSTLNHQHQIQGLSSLHLRMIFDDFGRFSTISKLT